MEDTIKGLTKTIEKLRKENKGLWEYKELFKDSEKKGRELERQLGIKRSVLKVQEQRNNTIYVRRIEKVFDTPEGLIITIANP